MNFSNNNIQNNMNMSGNLMPQGNQNMNMMVSTLSQNMNMIGNQMPQNMINNPNSLYMMNFQQTWQNMQPSVNLVNINFNNMTNILSLLNLPVVVPCHSQHPLIHCKTPGRIMPGTYWKCNGCGTDYSYNVPTFYCTACDFDLCQKCFLTLYAFQVVIYNYNLGNIQSTQQFTNNNFFNPKVHQHPTMTILREQTYFENKLKCNACMKDLQVQEQFNYCSLCNYCICLNCYQKMINN